MLRRVVDEKGNVEHADILGLLPCHLCCAASQGNSQYDGSQQGGKMRSSIRTSVRSERPAELDLPLGRGIKNQDYLGPVSVSPIHTKGSDRTWCSLGCTR